MDLEELANQKKIMRQFGGQSSGFSSTLRKTFLKHLFPWCNPSFESISRLVGWKTALDLETTTTRTNRTGKSIRTWNFSISFLFSTLSQWMAIKKFMSEHKQPKPDSSKIFPEYVASGKEIQIIKYCSLKTFPGSCREENSSSSLKYHPWKYQYPPMTQK